MTARKTKLVTLKRRCCRNISLLLGGAPPILRRAIADSAHRHFEIGDESLVRPVGGARARNQHIIGPRPTISPQNRGRRSPHPPLRAVAGYRIADFSTRGEPYADKSAAIRPVRPLRRLQDQTRCNRSAARAGDAQKIGAALECYKPRHPSNPGGLG